MRTGASSALECSTTAMQGAVPLPVHASPRHAMPTVRMGPPPPLSCTAAAAAPAAATGSGSAAQAGRAPRSHRRGLLRYMCTHLAGHFAKTRSGGAREGVGL